jgi:hypothetical protein
MVQQMNWKQGLVRLWAAVSLLWMICFLIYLYSDNLPAPARPEQQDQDTIHIVATIIGPPIAFLILGFGVWWVIAGFEAPKRRQRRTYGAYPVPADHETTDPKTGRPRE